MPMYEIPRVKSPEVDTKEKEIPKVSITMPTPDTTEALLALLSNLLTTKRVTYIRIYPESMSYEFVSPPPAEEVLQWYLDKLKEE